MSAAVALKRPVQPLVVPAAPAAAAVAANGLAFAFFLLVNATLFVRPADIIPDVRGWNIFLVLILINVALALPSVINQLSPAVLDQRPVTTCAIGLLFAVALSHLTSSHFEEAFEKSADFGKTLVYFLVLISVVDSPKRLRIFVLWLLFCATVMVLLAVLDFHKILEFAKIEKPIDHPEYTTLLDGRLSGPGLFQDPNDLCIMVVMAVPLCLYALTDTRWGPLRFVWLISLGLFLYGFSKTQSRGGLVALMAGIALFLRARYGWGRALLLGLLGLPLVALLLSGRQTEISAQTNTAHQRIWLWSSGLMFFRNAPLFGIGMDEFSRYGGLVAHNSYLHAFAELGAFGGLLFLGVVYLPASAMYRLCSDKVTILDPEMRRLYPYLLGALGGYATGMMALSLCYNMPTFTVLGMGAIFVSVAASRPAVLVEKFDLKLVGRMVAAGACFLAGMYVFVRVFKG
jgi:hypothetical protein